MITVTVTGLQPLQEMLSRAAERLADPRDLLEDLGGILEANVEQRFAAKRAPDGSAWAPWAPATVDAYTKADTVTRGPEAGTVKRRGTLLQRTGQMLDSLTTNVGDDYVQVGMSRNTDGGQWSIPLLHETGTKNMPARPMFLADWEAGTLGVQDERDLMDAVGDWLDDLFGEG